MLDQLNNIEMLLHLSHDVDLSLDDTLHLCVFVDLWQDDFDGDLLSVLVDSQLGFACGSLTKGSLDRVVSNVSWHFLFLSKLIDYYKIKFENRGLSNI
jgi:hypothetical protein